MRKLAAVLVLPIAAFIIAGCGSSTSTSSTPTGAPTSAKSGTTTQGVKVSAKSVPNLGTVLVNSQGLTLYTLAPDMHGKSHV